MPLKNSPIHTLHNLLDDNASSFMIAEVILEKSLENWVKEASDVKLKVVLQDYQDQVQQHIQMIGKFTDEEKISRLDVTSRIMNAFIEETDNKLSRCADTEIKDACLLSGIQIINHYKISMYGTAAAFAKAINLEKHAATFHTAALNEKKTDEQLTKLANTEINLKARAPIGITR